MGKNILINIPKFLKFGAGALLVGGGAALMHRGWRKFKENGIDNLAEESREQTIDPNTGQVVDNGHFKDVSKAMNSVKEGARYGRVGWKVAKTGVNMMKNSGLVGGIVKKLLSLPGLLVTKLLNSKLGKWLAKKGLTSGLEAFKVAFNKFMQKFAPKIAKKLSEKGGKKAAGNVLKRLPGIGLVWYLGQAFFAAYQGYKHAGKLLKIDENEVPTSLRVKTMFAKMLYDVGPELLVSLLKITPGGALGFALDVAVIILKEIFTWDRIVEMLGLGDDVRKEISEKHRAEKENAKGEHDIDKEEKGEKYSDDKKLKEEAQENARSREKGISDTPSNNTSANVASTNASNMLGGAMGSAMTSLTGGTPSSYGGGGSGGGGALLNSYGESPVSPDILKQSGGAADVEVSPGRWVKYIAKNGKYFIKYGGSRAWRNNNEGNIQYGDFAKNHGAIGTDGRFAIFPNEATGRAAKKALIFYGKNYRDKDLKGAISRYAPAFENDTNGYFRQVLNAVGGKNTIMRNYSESEQEAIMNAMRKVEGWKPGRIEGDTGALDNIAIDKKVATDLVVNPVGTMLNQVVNAANIKNDNINKTPKGVTESDGAYGSPSSATSKSSSNTNHFDDMPTSSNVTDTPTNFPVGSTSNASVTTNNVIVPETNGFAAIIDALSKQGGMQAASIVTGLTSLEALLGQILKAINNNKDEAMRLAASGAR